MSRLLQANRLLLLDDDTTLLETLQTFFESEGFTVDATASLDEVETLFRQNCYDAVVADLHLNDEVHDGGLRIATMLANRNPKPQLIILTGQSAMGLLRDPRMQGLAAFVHKPIRLQALNTLVRAACNGARAF